MQVIIIREHNALYRERWNFLLSTSYGHQCIYFDSYLIEYKDTERQRLWRVKSKWSRLMRRESTIESAPLPVDVINEAKEKFAELIKALPITY